MKAFWENIKKGFRWIASSADNNTNGASGRKLTAITFMALIIWGQYKFVDTSMWHDVLITYEVCIMLLLGIVTVEQIIKFKSGSSSTTTLEKKGDEGNSEVILTNEKSELNKDTNG